jgi:hypothetical protein
MAQDDDIAEGVIPGSLKRSPSYHSDYGKKTYKEIRACYELHQKWGAAL